MICFSHHRRLREKRIMSNEQDIRARLNALVQIKSATWLSEDSVRVYQQGSDPKSTASRP